MYNIPDEKDTWFYKAVYTELNSVFKNIFQHHLTWLRDCAKTTFMFIIHLGNN